MKKKTTMKIKTIRKKGGDELGNQVLNVTKVQLNSYNFGDLPAAQERYNDNLDKLQLSDQSSSASQCATPKEKASNDEIVELDDKHQALPKEIMGPKAADNAIGGAFLIQFNEELQKKSFACEIRGQTCKLRTSAES